MRRRSADDQKQSQAFDHWLVETCCSDTLTAEEREQRLSNWESAPSARFCHPREEHLLPLHVCFGMTASSNQIAKHAFSESWNGLNISAFLWEVAEQRSAPNEIDVDFMLHTGTDGASHGIAAPWSLSTQADDEISLFGPGPAKFINTDAECFLLAGDMTALPALTANLKLLPANARGKAFIEILSDADKQDLKAPDNVEIIWVINDAPGSDESPLFHTIEQADWQEGKLSVWVACEFKTMKKIRQAARVFYASQG